MLSVAAAAPVAATADQDAAKTTCLLSFGTELTSGDYGGDHTVEDFCVLVTGEYRTSRYAIRLTVPYLRVTAPRGTIIEGPGGQPIPGDGPNVTESGLGDVIVGLTVYEIWQAMNGSLALDVGGKIKLGTADEASGLGTGKTDFTLQADLIRFLPGFTAVGSVGYVARGDPNAFDLDDGFAVSLGGIFSTSPRMRVGAFIDYRQAAYEFNDDRLELVGMLSWRRASSRVSLSASAGLSDSAPDWGVGITLTQVR